MSLAALSAAIAAGGRRPWALERRRADLLAYVLAALGRGAPISAEQLQALGGSSPLPAPRRESLDARAARLARPQLVPAAGGGSVAIVSVRGLITYDVEYQPYAVSTKLLARIMRGLAADPKVVSIGIVVDSPGGAVTGTGDAADAVFAARKTKPCMAIVDPCACSAAYWIASQASEIVAVPDADVGSIGVFMLHVEISRALDKAGIKPTLVHAGEFKTEGNPLEPLTEDAKAFWQKECDAIHADFLKAVARGRGVSIATVRARFGQGRVVSARDALDLGMVDRLLPSDHAATRLQAGPRRQPRDGSLAAVFRHALAADSSAAADLERRRRLLLGAGRA